MLGAISAALASSFCFALAAALQHREAVQVGGSGVGGIRMLWQLCHRPWWLVGVASDALSVVLHVAALSMAALSLVQPLGVMGVVFAIPLGAAVRGQRIRPLDVVAALIVVAGLTAVLRAIPATTAVQVPGAGSVLLMTGVVAAVVLVATGGASVAAGRLRTLLLAAGAGTAFGATAVLVRALVLAFRGQASPGGILSTGGCVVLLAAAGYLLLQSAYRSGHFAGAVATATVLDPVVAVLAGAFLLHERLPGDPAGVLVVGIAGLVVCAGVAMLVRSPVTRSLAPGEAPAQRESTGRHDTFVV